MKTLKRILAYLEKIGFIKKKSEIIATSIEEPVSNNRNIEPSKIEEIPVISPSLTCDNNYTSKKEHLSDYKFGDIIWACRYVSEEEKNNIPKGHREGPYIVVESSEYCLICLYGTGTEPKSKSSEYRILTLKESSYHDILTKDTYIQVAVSTYITDNQITSYLGSLTAKDKKLLKKKIGICADEELYVTAKPECSNIPLEEGDIFNIGNQSYLIIISLPEVKTCLPLIQSNEPNAVVIDSVRYTIDYKNVLKLPDVSMYRRTSIISKKLLDVINLRYQNYQTYQASYGLISRGSIITLNDKYYLVNGEIGDTLTGFQLFTGNNHQGMAHFIINGQKYSSDFNKQITFLKKEHPYQFFANATDEEMENFKEIKKSYLKSIKSKGKKHKSKPSKVVYPNISSGSIVTELVKEKRYIVITRQETELVVISENDYNNFNYQLTKKDVHEVYYTSRMHPITFKALLQDLQNNTPAIKGHISQEHLKKLINEHI